MPDGDAESLAWLTRFARGLAADGELRRAVGVSDAESQRIGLLVGGYAGAFRIAHSSITRSRPATSEKLRIRNAAVEAVRAVVDAINKLPVGDAISPAQRQALGLPDRE